MNPINSLLPEDTPGRPPVSRRIRAGWLIDGRGGPVMKDVLVEFSGKTIHAVRSDGPWAGISEPVIDHTAGTLIPGLIDAHVHLFMSGIEDVNLRKRFLSDPFETARERILRHLRKHLSFGIIGVRDGGDHNGFAHRFKKECRFGSRLPIILHVAGKAWHNVGRYGSLIGRSPGKNEDLAAGILRESSGIDHVKILNSGINSLILYGKETSPQFQIEELRKGVDTAASLGLPVMVHSNGKIPTEIAVSAGCSSIEHGFFMGTENLDRMRDQDTIWVPTACTMKAFSGLYSGKSRDVSAKTLEHQVDQIRYARKIGLKIAVGSDSGSMGVHHGASIMDELSILLDAGYPIQNAIECAARNGALLLGLSDFGIIAPGKSATVVAVTGPPDQLPWSLSRISGIYINGNPYNVDAQFREDSIQDEGFFFNSG
ncbi:MAG: amidohydrolase family protein [Thermodesulfobacteriota bacterium]